MPYSSIYIYLNIPRKNFFYLNVEVDNEVAGEEEAEAADVLSPMQEFPAKAKVMLYLTT